VVSAAPTSLRSKHGSGSIDIAYPSLPAAFNNVGITDDANGQYVTADDAGANPLIANRDSVGQWEEFDLINE
jgi:hypothetical protein